MMVNTPVVIHTIPQVEEYIYHVIVPNKKKETQDKMEEFRDQFQELHNQVKALLMPSRLPVRVCFLCIIITCI